MSLVGTDQWVYVASCPSLPHIVKIGSSIDCDQRGATQRQVALTTGTSLRLVGEIERGKSTAQIGKVMKIMDVLKISMFCETQSI